MSVGTGARRSVCFLAAFACAVALSSCSTSPNSLNHISSGGSLDNFGSIGGVGCQGLGGTTNAEVVVANAFENTGKKPVKIISIRLLNRDGVETVTNGIYIGNKKTFDLWALPFSSWGHSPDNPEPEWAAKKSVLGMTVLGGKTIQTGIGMKLDASVSIGKIGPVQVTYTSAGKTYLRTGFERYELARTDCN